MSEKSFKFGDYVLALLELMGATVEGRGEDICQEFELKYRASIPTNHYDDISSGTDVRWHKHVNWARYVLKKAGFVEDPHRGIWKLSEVGRQWLEEHRAEPWDTRKGHLANQCKLPGVKRPNRATKQAPHLSYEQLVELKKSLPEEKFLEMFGAEWELYQLRNRAQIVTEIDDRKLVPLVKAKVSQIQDIVQGKTNPLSNPELCALIEFCYWLELFKEGAALFQRIDRSSLDDALYLRAKKIGETCIQRTL